MADPQMSVTVTLPPATMSLRDVERLHVLNALQHFGGNKTRTAKSLGADWKTLASRLKSFEAQARREERAT